MQPKKKPSTKSNKGATTPVNPKALGLVAPKVDIPPKPRGRKPKNPIIDALTSEIIPPDDIVPLKTYRDPETFLKDCMNERVLPSPFSLAAGRELMKAKLQREKLLMTPKERTQRIYEIGKKEATEAEAHRIVSGESESKWAGLINNKTSIN
jgi:hypothetical protein